MNINATLINLYHVCKREMWLHAHGIRMEHTSDTVAEGKLIGETSYPKRAAKYTELDLGVAKIDFYDEKNRVVHEIKKSNKVEKAHEWQVKYYLLLLYRAGITDATGILEYPKLRETKKVVLEQHDMEALKEAEKDIEAIVARDKPPERIRKSFCRKCSYFDLCWVGQ
jgi:CRISPR-associated exonuclease Cas4